MAVVMLVEDDEGLRKLLTKAITQLGYVVHAFAGAEQAQAQLTELTPDVVLTDVHLGGTDGIELCKAVREQRPQTLVLVMTAFGSLDTAVEAIRAGAWDFLTKPLDLGVLQLALERAIEHRQLNTEVRELRRQVRFARGFGELVGESPPMRALYKMLTRVAGVSSSVLVHGESGTGKELVARALHDQSPRSRAAFVAINCAAMPESLLESELFGHVKGAYTDAHTARSGLFIQADGGTLFLDEIGDMPTGLQAKLLRVLQERRVRPVGSEREVGVDVRVVAATHQDLERLVDEGRFREDLLYRLDVIRLELPPLRARGADVLLLGQQFLTHHAQRLGKRVDEFHPRAARKLLDYDWPGNVRELQNCIERAVVLADSGQVTVDDLPPKIQRHTPARHVLATTDSPDTMLPMHEVEKRYILQVLKACGGSKSKAARVLELDRKTLYRKLERWEAEASDA